MKSAKEWHQKFVSPAWILDSEDASTRLEESQYPPLLNPKMALGSLSFSSQPTPGPPSSQRTQNSPKKRRQVGPVVPADEEAGPSSPKTVRPPPSIPDETREQLEEETCQQLRELEQVMSRSTEPPPADPTPARLRVSLVL